MTLTAPARRQSATGTGPPWASWTSAGARAASAALGGLSILAISSGLVDLLGTGDTTSTFLIVGTLSGLAAAGLLALVRPPDRIRDPHVLAAVAAALPMAVGLLAGLYLLVGSTTSVVDALAEATAGLTTTALGAIEPAGGDYGLRFLRAASQWVGGLGALFVGVAILPFFGAGREFADRSRMRGRRPMTPTQRIALRNILVVYGASSGVVWLAYAIAGLSVFESLLVAMATVSTGGLVDGDPFAQPAVQWAAIGGMVAAGTSLVVLWRLAVGRAQGLWRSAELRVYLGLLAIGTLLFLFWTGGTGPEDVRHAAFAVTAAVTTTGFRSAPAGTWSAAAPVLLLGLVSIGPMTGSAGGGFQILRHRALLQIALREMVRQIHPRAVVRVRLGGRVAAEDTLARVVVTQFLSVSVIFMTAITVAVLGVDLVSAIGAAVHAVSTAGPVRALDGTVLDPSAWPSPARLALLPAMIIGRLSIYPALLALSGGLALGRNRIRLARRIRSYRGRMA